MGYNLLIISCLSFCFKKKSTNILYLDPLQESLLNTVQDRVVLNDSQVFSLGLEHLARVLARGHGTNGHLLGLHLLGDLASGWFRLLVGVCFNVL